jgi:MYXO-CTERM domain-containing protein
LTYPVGFYNGDYAAKCWNMIPGAPAELWVQYVVKYSSNYQFHPIDNKQTYYFTGDGDSVNNWYITTGGSRHINVVTQTFATDRHLPNTGYDPYINANQWYKIRAHFVMNAPGVMNGILQVWVDDGLVIDKSNVGYVSQSEGLREAQIAPVFGGMASEHKLVEDYQYYDHVIISTSPIASPQGADVSQRDGGVPTHDVGGRPALRDGASSVPDTGSPSKLDRGSRDETAAKACISTKGCASGEVCSIEGQCVKISNGDHPQGCSCEVGVSAAGERPGMALLMLGIIVLIRRGRRRRTRTSARITEGPGASVCRPPPRPREPGAALFTR